MKEREREKERRKREGLKREGRVEGEYRRKKEEKRKKVFGVYKNNWAKNFNS